MNDINVNESKYHDDYLIRLSRLNLVGWGLAFTFLLVSLYLFTRPKEAIGVDDNGVVVGAIVFDEPRTRPMDRVISDAKKWAVACHSANKISIYQDMALCVTHFSEELKNERLGNSTISSESDPKNISKSKKLEEYIFSIAESGCDKTETVFDDRTSFQTDKSRLWVKGAISGHVICKEATGAKRFQEFKIDMTAKIVLKTEAKPLGLEVHKYEDIL